MHYQKAFVYDQPITQTFSFIRKLLFFDQRTYHTTCFFAHPAKFRSWPTGISNHLLQCAPSRTSFMTNKRTQPCASMPSQQESFMINQHSKTNASWTTQHSKLPPCPPSMPNYLLSCCPSKDSSMINKHARAHVSLPNQCTKQRFLPTQHSKLIASMLTL